MSNSGCCGDFVQETAIIEQTPNQVSLDLRDCGAKRKFKAKIGEEFKWGMPVKLDGETIVPTLDGSNAIGISLGEGIAEDGDYIMVQRTGHFDWRDVAVAIGKDPLSNADWAEFYATFNKDALFVENTL